MSCVRLSWLLISIWMLVKYFHQETFIQRLLLLLFTKDCRLEKTTQNALTQWTSLAPPVDQFCHQSTQRDHQSLTLCDRCALQCYDFASDGTTHAVTCAASDCATTSRQSALLSLYVNIHSTCQLMQTASQLNRYHVENGIKVYWKMTHRFSDSLSRIVACDQLIMWLSRLARSVKADLFCSDKLCRRWPLVNGFFVIASTSVLRYFSL